MISLKCTTKQCPQEACE